jgi:hypothetical protein
MFGKGLEMNGLRACQRRNFDAKKKRIRMPFWD